MMPETTTTGMRILIGAGSSADASAALLLVESLQKVFRASLGGIFIEEPHTGEISRFPNRRVITKSGMTMLAPTPTQIRIILQAEARAFQQSLKRATAPEAPENPFLRQQGELVGTALSAAKGWDVLVLGCRPLHRIIGSIVLLCAAGAQNDQLRHASKSLSEHFATNSVSFVIGSVAKNDAASRTAGTLTFDTTDEAIAMLTRTNALAVLVDLRDGVIRSQSDLARIFEAARCPLIVFGATRQAPTLEHSTQIPPSPSQDEHRDDR